MYLWYKGPNEAALLEHVIKGANLSLSATKPSLSWPSLVNAIMSCGGPAAKRTPITRCHLLYSDSVDDYLSMNIIVDGEA